MFDLAEYEDAENADVTIRDPKTNAATQIVITVAGPSHPARKRIQFDRQRRMNAQLEKTGKVRVPDPEEDELDTTDMLAACTLGWTGLVFQGEPVVFSPDAAKRLYADPRRRWLRDQVRAALDERELIIRRSATA